jgi:hypothetical protein
VSACARCGVDSGLPLCPACLLRDDVPPPTVGGLELVEEIGSGGMGRVWRARDPRLQRDVAVKFLDAPPGAEETRERLRREARALASLDHPGIVRVLDIGEDDEQAWLVMELVEGRPLSDLVPLPGERAAAVALQVAEALAYAHARGIVHRDVKPSNVLVDAQGRARLLDFGIARRTDVADGITRQGLVAGSPPYMAPEAFAGGPPDPRVDVYALGAVLREMLGDARPPGLDALVRRAMDADPARRPADGAALAAELRALSHDTPYGLPEDERTLLHAVALLHTLATAAALWAIVQSVTPRVLGAQDVGPLVMLHPEPLEGGGVVSRARFETWPVLVAVAAAVVALVGRAFLKRHWRQAGLDVPAAGPLPEARLVLWLGLAACGMFLVRRVLFGTSGSLAAYVPILGGLLELAIVHVAWVAVLEASRTRRPLAGLVPLWAGLVFALCPPVYDLLRYLAAWRP